MFRWKGQKASVKLGIPRTLFVPRSTFSSTSAALEATLSPMAGHLNSGSILIALGDESESVFVQTAMAKAGITDRVQVVHSDQEAIGYLGGVGAYRDRVAHPLPFLMLLDLKLPVAGGLGVLRWMRAQPELRAVVVIALSSSNLADDVQAACALGANSCVCRPSNQDELVKFMKAIKGFWIDINCFAAPVLAAAPGPEAVARPAFHL